MMNDKWNEEAAPNNNLEAETYDMNHKKREFSEELSDGGDRNKMAELQKENMDR